MTRQFQIFGEMMVCVNFGAHIPVVSAPALEALSGAIGIPILSRLSNLGLLAEPARVQLNFKHQDVKVDPFGQAIGIDEQFMLADAVITTRLVHWDADIMELCLREATAGGDDPTGRDPAGTLAPAGSIMGGGCPPAQPGVPFIPASGYHYVSLNLISALPGSQPWRFPAAYLTGPPTVFPLGTQYSVAECTWRAVPYGVFLGDQALISGGAGGGLVTSGSVRVGLTIKTAIPVTEPTSTIPGTQSIPRTIFLWDHTADSPVSD